MAIGPIQLIAIGFDEPDFRGAIRRELAALRGLGAIRLIDVLFVAKDDLGGMTRMEMSDLSEEEKIEFGALIGGMIGLGAGDWETAELGAELGALAASENVFGVSGEELSAFMEDLEPGTAAALLLLEHRWAIDFRDAVLDAGGEFLLQGYLTPDTLLVFGAELEAQAEAAAAIEAAEEAVAISEAIQAEAARRAIAALVAADLIAEAAMDEAAGVVADALAIEAIAEEEAEAAIDEADEVIAAAELAEAAAIAEAEDVEEAAAEIEAAAIVDVIRTLLAAELIEEAAIDDVVDTLVDAGMIEDEAAEEAAAAILAVEGIEDAE
jgi:uncharacterized membrane protein